MKNTGIIICSRTDSNRVPNKPFRKINGVACIVHLIKRLQKTGLPIYVAVPKEQLSSYIPLSVLDQVHIHTSHYGEDPLARMVECAEANKIKTVVRVTHDKIFVENRNVEEALQSFNTRGLDYLFSSRFVAGSGFEVISLRALKEASRQFKNIEHISYAIRKITQNSFDFDPKHPRGGYRFLIDFPEDLQLLDVVLSQVGNDGTLLDALKYVNSNPELKLINAQPTLTVYTCAFNAADYIERCMEHVEKQKGFSKIEYILIDDHSTDKTPEMIAKFSVKHKNVKFIRNDQNIGLASSSNVALKNARGKYIMRIDADDFFPHVHTLNEMIQEIEKQGKEVIYPNNYFGSYNVIQAGKEHHHVGGAIFDKRAIDHIKFTDGLRGHDSLDVFLRAKDILKVGYLDRPTFFYTQREDSMSKTNKAKRSKIREALMLKHNQDLQ